MGVWWWTEGGGTVGKGREEKRKKTEESEATRGEGIGNNQLNQEVKSPSNNVHVFSRGRQEILEERREKEKKKKESRDCYSVFPDGFRTFFKLMGPRPFEIIVQFLFIIHSFIIS
jgi:hypothetical protein